MYGFEEMIEMGFTEDTKYKEFPTEAHRQVAVTLAIGNQYINSRDKLINVVQSVCSVPENLIKKVTLNDLICDYNLDYILF